MTNIQMWYRDNSELVALKNNYFNKVPTVSKLHPLRIWSVKSWITLLYQNKVVWWLSNLRLNQDDIITVQPKNTDLWLHKKDVFIVKKEFVEHYVKSLGIISFSWLLRHSQEVMEGSQIRRNPPGGRGRQITAQRDFYTFPSGILSLPK